MSARISLGALLATTSLSGPSRVSGSFLAATLGLHGPVRVSGQYLVAVGGFGRPTRVSGQYLVSVHSVHTAVYPDLLESESIVYDLNQSGGSGGLGFLVEASAAPTPETNPYRPAIPEQLAGLGETYYNFQNEQQQTLREQHNLTQAGDTTFPYQILLSTHSIKQYTLGAIGRFFEQDYGVIHARYVQFDSMVQAPTPCYPVGLFKSGETLDWRVTNKIESSDPTLVVGMTPQILLPVDGEYGWVIVDGPNLQEVKNDSTTFAQGETFAWSATGKVSNAAQGRIVGRRINKTANKILPVGSLWINLESWSLASIVAEVEGVTAGLTSDIAHLQADVDVLKSITNLTATFATINQKFAALTTRVSLEEKARAQADTALSNRITGLPYVTTGQLGAAVTDLSNSITTVSAALSSRITVAKDIADRALAAAMANSFDPTVLNAQLSAILDAIDVIRKAPKGKFPVVDGRVPPNLVYLDDGSLVYTETF